MSPMAASVHVAIRRGDGAPRKPPTIITGIAKLGFKVTDVKVMVHLYATFHSLASDRCR